MRAEGVTVLSRRSNRRLIGSGMLVSMGLGIYSNFALQERLFAPPGLLANAASQPQLVGLTVLTGLLTSLLSLGVAVLFANLLRGRLQTGVRLYLCVVAAGLALSLAEHAILHAFAELGARHAAAAAEHAGSYTSAAQALSGLRNGVHFLDKWLGGFGVAAFFLLALLGHVLPRWLAGFGLLAALYQMGAITPALLGGEVRTLLLAPLALAYLVAAVWLVGRDGIEDADPDVRRGGRSADA